MPYPGRNNIYKAAIRRMVAQALEEQELEFAARHTHDSDGQLLAYLCHCSEALSHTPWPWEILGGRLIEQRFGTWQEAVQQAKLPMPHTPDQVSGFARYQEETERQKVLYREKKAVKKQRAQQRISTQKEKQSV